MNRKFTINPLNGTGIEEAIAGLDEFQSWLKVKSDELCSRLAMLGATTASLKFSSVNYIGRKDVNIDVEKTARGYLVKANGEPVLFLEFGSGIKNGYGHPEAKSYDTEYGPGTWSDGPHGKGHWRNRDGWYLPKSAGGGKSDGNSPAMAMYGARKEIEQQIGEIVREVFADD